MATLIGVVSQVVGQVFAVAGDGARRILVEGDRLYAGDQLLTGDTGAVAVKMQNGSELTLGRDSSLHMTPELLSDQAPQIDTNDAPTATQLTDVEQLQRAIAAGDDPTQNAEPTAAGPGATTGAPGVAGGGHSFVLVEEVGGAVAPIVGLETIGLQSEIIIPQLVINPLLAADADAGGLPPVVPPVDNGVLILDLDVDGGEQVVLEANLPDGNDPDAAALSQSGTFRVSAPDGLDNLTIDGVEVVRDGVFTAVTITSQNGNQLAVTGYENGQLSYTYTLLDHEQHNVGENQLSDDFYVVARDVDGDSDDAWLNVRIIDDQPRAVDDNAGPADEQHVTLEGTVLSNDKIGADFSADPVTPLTQEGKYGSLVLNADGTYTYTLNTADADFLALGHDVTATESFSYTITDSDGDTASANLNIQVNNLNDGVTILDLGVNGGEQIVFEANLPNGTDPDSAALSKSGAFNVDAKDGLANLTIDGVDVIKDGVFEAVTITSQNGNQLEVTGYQNGQLTYTYTLLDAEQHNAGDAQLSDDFHVIASDVDGDTDDAWLNVRIVDDQPQANGQVQTVNSGEVSSNVLLVIDTSGSMTFQSGVMAADGHEMTRLELAQQSIMGLLDQYADLGDVRVQIVTFNTQANELSETWVTVAEAKVLIGGLTAEGGTNYDFALTEAASAFDASGKLEGGQNLAYFFSDGNPTLSKEYPTDTPPQYVGQTNENLGDGIQADEQAAWTSFLQTHDINAFAIGLGQSAQTQYMDPVAYNGATNTDTGSVVVTQLDQLDAVLSGTVKGSTVSGSLLDGGKFGADGGHVEVVIVDDKPYFYDASKTEISITTELGGTFAVDMKTGKYTYTAPSESTTATEKLDFVLIDNDGDTAGASVVINVVAPTTPVANDAANSNVAANAALSESAVVASPRIEIARDQFKALSATTAALLITGFLDGASAQTLNDRDTYTVHLAKGETLTAGQDGGAAAHVAWSLDGENFTNVNDGGSFTATESGVYTLRVDNASATAETYALNLNVDSSHASAAAVQAVEPVSAAAHDDATASLVVHSTASTAALTSSAGNDVISGGEATTDTANFATATAGVHVDLAQTGWQDTGGAGLDKLVSMENLIGSKFDDTLAGNAQDNVIAGGQGNDVLTGAGGNDTFQWLKGDTGHDTVTDFSLGNDTLDLSQLLQGEKGNANSLDQYLNFKVTGTGADAVSTIEVSATANGPVTQTIDLQHVDLATQYHVTPGAGGMLAAADTASIINGMLGDHSLKVDTV